MLLPERVALGPDLTIFHMVDLDEEEWVESWEKVQPTGADEGKFSPLNTPSDK